MLPGKTDGDRTNWAHLAPLRLLTKAPDLLDNSSGVSDRFSVRHCVDTSEPAKGCGPRPGLDRFCIFTPRLAQMRMEIYESWQRDEAVCIDRACAASVGLPCPNNLNDSVAVHDDVDRRATEG